MTPRLVGSSAAILVAVDVEDETLYERLEKQVVEQRTAVVFAEAENGHCPDILITTRLSGSQGLPTVLLSDDLPNEFGSPIHDNVRAVLPTNVASRELCATIEAVAEGLAVMTAGMFHALLETGLHPAPDAPEDGNFEPILTWRERQVLALLADGGSNKHIARSLDVSVHTAKFHVSTLMSKLRARSRADVVAIGLRRGLIAL